MTTQEASGPAFVEIRRHRGKTSLILGGEWTVRNAAPIQQAVTDAKQELGDQTFDVVGRGIEKLDTSGALLLKKLLPDHAPAHLTKEQQELLAFLPQFFDYKAKAKKASPRIVAFFVAIGKTAVLGIDFLYGVMVFIGRLSVCFARNLSRPRHFRLPSMVRHVSETGLSALPIVGLLAVLISMVITYQGAVQLRKFGADIFTVDLTVIALLREMGVLVTAIMVAGRSGSAFAAEIGVMTMREEVNALRTMGMDPIEVLVVPRVIALVVALPLLTFLADVIGLAGGAIMSTSLLDISFRQYFHRVQDVANATTFFVGIIKAPVFAFVIAVIGCYQGMNASGSAESVGKLTTLAVVQAIFVVIMTDAFFSVVFSKVGI